MQKINKVRIRWENPSFLYQKDHQNAVLYSNLAVDIDADVTEEEAVSLPYSTQIISLSSVARGVFLSAVSLGWPTRPHSYSTRCIRWRNEIRVERRTKWRKDGYDHYRSDWCEIGRNGYAINYIVVPPTPSRRSFILMVGWILTSMVIQWSLSIERGTMGWKSYCRLLPSNGFHSYCRQFPIHWENQRNNSSGRYSERSLCVWHGSDHRWIRNQCYINLFTLSCRSRYCYQSVWWIRNQKDKINFRIPSISRMKAFSFIREDLFRNRFHSVDVSENISLNWILLCIRFSTRSLCSSSI